MEWLRRGASVWAASEPLRRKRKWLLKVGKHYWRTARAMFGSDATALRQFLPEIDHLRRKADGQPDYEHLEGLVRLLEKRRKEHASYTHRPLAELLSTDHPAARAFARHHGHDSPHSWISNQLDAAWSKMLHGQVMREARTHGFDSEEVMRRIHRAMQPVRGAEGVGHTRRRPHAPQPSAARVPPRPAAPPVRAARY